MNRCPKCNTANPYLGQRRDEDGCLTCFACGFPANRPAPQPAQSNVNLSHGRVSRKRRYDLTA